MFQILFTFWYLKLRFALYNFWTKNPEEAIVWIDKSRAPMWDKKCRPDIRGHEGALFKSRSYVGMLLTANAIACSKDPTTKSEFWFEDFLYFFQGTLLKGTVRTQGFTTNVFLTSCNVISWFTLFFRNQSPHNPNFANLWPPIY